MPVEEWHTVQLSPSTVVLARKWDAAAASTWQPEHADAVACAGFVGPCGSTTGFKPTGRFCSLPFTWHIEQFLKSVAAPAGLRAGNSVPLKSLWLPPKTTTT